MNRVVTQEQNEAEQGAAAFGQEPSSGGSGSSMICMSVVADGPRIAFAAYNEEQNQIVLDVCVADGYEAQVTVERILATVRPTLLLLSSKIIGNDNLLGILTVPPPAEEAETGDDGVHGAAQTQNNVTGAPATAPTTAAPAPATAATATTTTTGRNRPRSIPYRLMKTAAFDIRNCKELILQKLRVRSLMNQQQQQQGAAGHGGVPFDNNGRHFPNNATNNQDQQFRIASYHAIAAVVDFESTAQVQAVGSLLSFLHGTIFRMEEGGRMTVNDVVQARASMYMNISSSTLSALHVFSTEHHPLVAKGAGNSKEGVSLFSLLDRTMSRAGRKRLREWMLRPLLDLDAIAMRQDGVELFMLPEMQSPAGKILKLLEAIGPIEQILVRIQKCSTKPSDFLVLSKALAAAAAIHSSLGEILWSLRQHTGPNPAQFVQEGGAPMETWGGPDPQSEHYLAFLDTILNRCQMPLLQQLHERIGSIVNEEATNELQCVVIKRGYNENLDTEKDKYSRLGGESIVSTVLFNDFET
jgi:DNA mismatch repair ATPase MutS